MAQRLEQRYLDTIPEFRGNNVELPYFIKTAEALITKFYNYNDVNDYDNFVLIANVRAKVKGEALTAISNFSINSWTDLKNALLNTYSDKRDCFTLAIEIASLQQTNENAFEYLNKIQTLLNAHTAYVETQIEEAKRATFIEYGQKLAIRSLLKGLKDPLRSLVQTRNPQTLAGVSKILMNDFQYEAGRTMNVHNSTQSRVLPKQNFIQPKSTNIIRPINILQFTNPRPQTSQQRFPDPPAQIRQNQPQPTPMSVSTRQTWQRPQYQRTQNSQRPQNTQQHRFQAQSRPTFVSRELFNMNELQEECEQVDQNVQFESEEFVDMYDEEINDDQSDEQNHFLALTSLENISK